MFKERIKEIPKDPHLKHAVELYVCCSHKLEEMQDLIIAKSKAMGRSASSSKPQGKSSIELAIEFLQNTEKSKNDPKIKKLIADYQSLLSLSEKLLQNQNNPSQPNERMKNFFEAFEQRNKHGSSKNFSPTQWINPNPIQSLWDKEIKKSAAYKSYNDVSKNNVRAVSS